MKIKEIVERILAYHPALPDYQGCDEFKCGDPDQECTGVVTAMSATVNVLKEAAALGANLVVVHEPTNYTTHDKPGWHEDFNNSVFDEKTAFAAAHGITVWRDHDHMHAHRPDGIFTGVLKYLGWLDYSKVDTDTGAFAHFIVTLPEPVKLRDLLKHLTETIGLNGCRYIGDPDADVQKLAFVGHLFSMQLAEKNADGTPKEYAVQIEKSMEEGIDVILPGEVIDWTILSYVRDAVQLGKHKAMINLGHYNWEELGMRYAEEWLGDLLKDTSLNVTYVPSEDMYRYYVK